MSYALVCYYCLNDDDGKWFLISAHIAMLAHDSCWTRRRTMRVSVLSANLTDACGEHKIALANALSSVIARESGFTQFSYMRAESFACENTACIRYVFEKGRDIRDLGIVGNRRDRPGRIVQLTNMSVGLNQIVNTDTLADRQNARSHHVAEVSACFSRRGVALLLRALDIFRISYGSAESSETMNDSGNRALECHRAIEVATRHLRHPHSGHIRQRQCMVLLSPFLFFCLDQCLLKCF